MFVDYTFQFSEVFKELPYLLGGAIITLQIAFITFWAGAVIGIFGAVAKVYGGAIAQRVTTLYVSFFTNTPALVQVFMLYYALPDAGVLLSPMAAVLIGLTLNAGAYLTEILRGGVIFRASIRDGCCRDTGNVAITDSPACHAAAHCEDDIRTLVELFHLAGPW